MDWQHFADDYAIINADGHRATQQLCHVAVTQCYVAKEACVVRSRSQWLAEIGDGFAIAARRADELCRTKLAVEREFATQLVGCKNQRARVAVRKINRKLTRFAA